MCSDILHPLLAFMLCLALFEERRTRHCVTHALQRYQQPNHAWLQKCYFMAACSSQESSARSAAGYGQQQSSTLLYVCAHRTAKACYRQQTICGTCTAALAAENTCWHPCICSPTWWLCSAADPGHCQHDEDSRRQQICHSCCIVQALSWPRRQQQQQQCTSPGGPQQV